MLGSDDVILQRSRIRGQRAWGLSFFGDDAWSAWCCRGVPQLIMFDAARRGMTACLKPKSNMNVCLIQCGLSSLVDRRYGISHTSEHEYECRT